MVNRLTVELASLRPVVIAGDFNAWTVEWASRLTNQRGQILLEALAKLNVDLANVGTKSTYSRNGAEPIIDVTFCSSGLTCTSTWRVVDGYGHSDHQAVRYSIEYNPRQRVAGRVNTPITCRWRIPHFDEEVFVEALSRECNKGNMVDPSSW